MTIQIKKPEKTVSDKVSKTESQNIAYKLDTLGLTEVRWPG